MAFLTSRLRNPADRESQEKPRIDGVFSRERRTGHRGAEATARSEFDEEWTERKREEKIDASFLLLPFLYFIYLSLSFFLYLLDLLSLLFFSIDTTYKLIMNDPIENVLAPLEPSRIVSTMLRKKRP